MISLFQEWARPILGHLLAPPQCEACEQWVEAGASLCELCQKNLKPLRPSHCSVCALPFGGEMLSPHPCQDCLTRPPSYRKATAVFEFEGSASTLLHAAKFRGNTRALKWLARQAQANFLELCEEFQPQYLLPVPLSWRRKWKRGFNQSYLLAHYLRKAYGKDLPIWQEIRRSHTEAQSQKNRKDRLRALKGVFSLRRISSLQGAKILVMDDVMTTGATVETLSRAVLAAGAGEVRVFVLARVGKK